MERWQPTDSFQLHYSAIVAQCETHRPASSLSEILIACDIARADTHIGE
jgi:hypothetical protein